MTNWQDWDSADRQAGQPLDVALFDTWRNRLHALRNQSCPTWEYDQDYVTSDTTEHAGTGSFDLWVPPHAERLLLYGGMRIGLVDASPLQSGIGYTYIYINAVKIVTFNVTLRCRQQPIGTCVGVGPGADGLPSAELTYFTKSASIDVTAYRDSVITLSTAFRAANTNVDLVGFRTRNARWRWQEAA